MSGQADNHDRGRQALSVWQQAISKNVYLADPLLDHTVDFALGKNSENLKAKLNHLGENIASNVEPLVAENDFRFNLPRTEIYNGIGELTNQISHHPNYEKVGDVIYGTGMMADLIQPGQLTQSLLLFYLTSHLGEAGHNCPVACTAGVIRILSKINNFAEKETLLKKLSIKSYQQNYTGAQFVTEVQGGSDVAQNVVRAEKQVDGGWQIFGEKWFCSNANADVMLMTARYDKESSDTRGLGLFLVKRYKTDGTPNAIFIRRLKEKLGTRAMASAEIEFQGAEAFAMGAPEDGFKMLMQNVLHLSRIYNSFAILGAAQRAYQIARSYAKYRIAFSQPIENYPLVQERLADIRAENTALLASALSTTKLQDEVDINASADSRQLLILRMRANINKYYTATRSVEHIHHCIDVLAGNGAIETFSSLPRLLRDAIVYENWEGTHNTLRMQILRDIHRYDIGEIFIQHLIEKITALEHSTDKQIVSWIVSINAELVKLEQSLQNLKTANNEVQTLLVRDFIDELCILDAIIHLVTEAEHQLQTQNKKDKLKLVHWLLIKNNVITEKKYSALWMKVMAEVISI